MRALQRILLIAACIFAVLAIAVVAFVVALTSKPQEQVQTSTMDPNGKLELREQENGEIHLSWPAGTNADGYLIEILQEDTILHSLYASGETSCSIPQLPQDKPATIRINTLWATHNADKEGMRLGENALEVTAVFETPHVSDLEWKLDKKQHSVTFTYELSNGSSFILYSRGAEGNLTQLDKLTATEKTVFFGANGDCPMPTDGESAVFAMAAITEANQYTFYGIARNILSLQRADLLENTLQLACRHEGQNVYTFYWNDVDADCYELQVQNADGSGWTSLCKISRSQKPTFTTQNLERFTTYQFRIVAYTGSVFTDEAFVAEPAKFQLTTGTTAVYCTVWPQKDLEVFQDVKKKKAIGVAPAGQAFCVLDVENTLFKVRFGDGYGYIDSNYCMINLAEYLADQCSYDITNSYGAVITAHGYAFPGITGTALPGYENVALKENRFMVPLLYPAAQKLEKVAREALTHNLRLKIYDAYRPMSASEMLYEKISGLTDSVLPDVAYDGKPGAFSGLTYWQLMTNSGQYAFADFLTPAGSLYNQGLALDLTLEDPVTGKEISMQSDMHDLSHYSVADENHADAQLLKQLMLDGGFSASSTQWWHFWDDTTQKKLNLYTFLPVGVTEQCWMWDGNGWLYRYADGTYCKDSTAQIEGTTYTFDSNGYVTE